MVSGSCSTRAFALISVELTIEPSTPGLVYGLFLFGQEEAGLAEAVWVPPNGHQLNRPVHVVVSTTSGLSVVGKQGLSTPVPRWALLQK